MKDVEDKVLAEEVASKEDIGVDDETKEVATNEDKDASL
jgi:hypothetical protein